MSLVIDCDTCVRQATSACEGCFVSYLVDDRSARPGVVIDIASFAAVRRLQAAGMVPVSQHRSEAG